MSNCNYFGSDELVCEHKGSYDRAHCCYGLCRECLDVLQQNTERDKTEEEEEDGDDINVYLNTEREKNYKTIVWELMNKNYIEEQASEISADDTKIRKERKRRREGDIDRGAKPTKEKQKEQRLSSRINYDAFSQFYETDNNGITSEHGNEEESKEEFNREATEDYNEEEEEACGDDKSAEDQGYDDFRDLGEDRGEGNYNEFDEF
ncbi:myb-like protein W [Asparagus officinalis]|uniref:myb-like protein W n=1 Tax=Asparagus officinalis TaxID=4686 RepID=UPI00098E78FE|nr:myb-like protein W [Asparagus officinalis]